MSKKLEGQCFQPILPLTSATLYLPLVDRLDKLNQTLSTAINSPRNLYVSSPESISDAVSILADINRMNIQSSGLG